MSYLIKPKAYSPVLNKYETEQGIKVIKDFFQDNLATGLCLRRVTGPLFVLRGLGINDDLSGKERPVTFPIKDLQDAHAEVVHSLAKWISRRIGRLSVRYSIGRVLSIIRI